MSTEATGTGVHPSAVGPDPSFDPSKQQSTDTGVSNVATQGSHDDSTVNENPSGMDDEYPEQKHAGRVGLGPEYGKKNKETHGITAKIAGYKEEIKGTITRNSDLVQKGRDRRTGELAQKEEAAKDNDDPFKKEDQAKQQDDSSSQPQPTTDNPTGPGNIQQEHSSHTAAREQAATTHPEGTAGAERQRVEGTELQRDAQMNSVVNNTT